MPALCLRTGGAVSTNEASGHGFCLVADGAVSERPPVSGARGLEAEEPITGRIVCDAAGVS
jgi:hypothetical protein